MYVFVRMEHSRERKCEMSGGNQQIEFDFYVLADSAAVLISFVILTCCYQKSNFGHKDIQIAVI